MTAGCVTEGYDADITYSAGGIVVPFGTVDTTIDTIGAFLLAVF